MDTELRQPKTWHVGEYEQRRYALQRKLGRIIKEVKGRDGFVAEIKTPLGGGGGGGERFIALHRYQWNLKTERNSSTCTQKAEAARCPKANKKKISRSTSLPIFARALLEGLGAGHLTVNDWNLIVY